MIRTFLSYSAVALVVQLMTGLLTKFAEIYFIAGTLGDTGLGEYKHFMLVLELSAGVFIVGMDHALVRFVHQAEKNYGRFLSFFASYASAVTLLGVATAFLFRDEIRAATFLAFLTLGPFVTAEIGKIIFRARLEKKREFGFLAAQSLIWSLGCMATVPYWPNDLVPIGWTIAAVGGVGAAIYFVLWNTESEDGRPKLCSRPFSPEYSGLWASYRPLWIAGAAFLANIHIQSLCVDRLMSVRHLGQWAFVHGVMVFVQKPLMLVQRATLPIFSRDKSQLYSGFRQLVRFNLLSFPVLGLSILAVYPWLLSFDRFKDFNQTWDLLACLIAVLPIMAVEFLVASLSMAMDLPKNNRNAHVFAALINVPASYLLVSQFGLIGAGFGAALYTLVFGAAMFLAVHRQLPEYVRFVLRFLPIALFAYWGGILLIRQMENHVLAGIIAILGYIILSRLGRVWTPEDVANVLSWVKTPKNPEDE